MFKRIGLIALLVLLPSLANAQSTVTQIDWEHASATPAQVATFNTVVKVDNVVVTTAPTCVANGVNTSCRVPIGVLANGSHTFYVSTTVDSVLRETVLTKVFPLTGGNAQPTNPKFIITITITGS